MIKVGSRFAPLFSFFLFVPFAFQQNGQFRLATELQLRRQPTWTLEIPCWILSVQKRS
jgi:hypothetical protein